jgi:hypothetical protein
VGDFFTISTATTTKFSGAYGPNRLLRQTFGSCKISWASELLRKNNYQQHEKITRISSIDVDNKNVMNELTEYYAIVANIRDQSLYVVVFVMGVGNKLNIIATSGFHVAFVSSLLRKPTQNLRVGRFDL